ncbi:LPS biosynthesis protein WbpP [Verrucomicrobia bacterium LW23]|nr:LPS biosynthesis protein WbpP [Verrucomicrobia bacterium LW23]
MNPAATSPTPPPPTYPEVLQQLQARPRRWLVTGAAGFIGSHLVETLLKAGQTVIAFDNFSTGSPQNLAEAVGGAERVHARTSRPKSRFTLVEGDSRDPNACRNAMTRGVDYVLHHAAISEAPSPNEQMVQFHAENVTGMLLMLEAAQAADVQRFVYASSSDVYGDAATQPCREDITGRALSPFALSKQMNEMYASLYARLYNLSAVGLRYFQVFGPRQNLLGDDIIARWITAMLRGGEVVIPGEGDFAADYCYVANIVQANIMAACCPLTARKHMTCNIASSRPIRLLELFLEMRAAVAVRHKSVRNLMPSYRPPQPGELRPLLPDITRARTMLGYEPMHDVAAGLEASMLWYEGNLFEG